jgi:hypothetical protein
MAVDREMTTLCGQLGRLHGVVMGRVEKNVACASSLLSHSVFSFTMQATFFRAVGAWGDVKLALPNLKPNFLSNSFVCCMHRCLSNETVVFIQKFVFKKHDTILSMYFL